MALFVHAAEKVNSGDLKIVDSTLLGGGLRERDGLIEALESDHGDVKRCRAGGVARETAAHSEAGGWGIRVLECQVEAPGEAEKDSSEEEGYLFHWISAHMN